MRAENNFKFDIVRVSTKNFEIYKGSLKKLLRENMLHHLENGKVNENYFEVKTSEIKAYLEEERAVIYVYIIENDVKGCIWAYPKFFLDENRLFIQLLQVSVENRSIGIGRELLKRIENYAKQNNYDSLELITSYGNSRAIKFYKREKYEMERIQFIKKLV